MSELDTKSEQTIELSDAQIARFQIELDAIVETVTARASDMGPAVGFLIDQYATHAASNPHTTMAFLVDVTRQLNAGLNRIRDAGSVSLEGRSE